MTEIKVSARALRLFLEITGSSFRADKIADSLLSTRDRERTHKGLCRTHAGAIEALRAPDPRDALFYLG